MKTLSLQTMQQSIGKEIGKSDWFLVSQEDVDKFAEVTRDFQFIHVDVEKAAHTPFGGTIAHGFYTLSLLSYFAENGMSAIIEGTKMGLNYGVDKIRFLHPVPVGSRIRGVATLAELDEKQPGQFLIKISVTVEIEGKDKPALVAEWLTMNIL